MKPVHVGDRVVIRRRNLPPRELQHSWTRSPDGGGWWRVATQAGFVPDYCLVMYPHPARETVAG